jgi:hypothetical protein
MGLAQMSCASGWSSGQRLELPAVAIRLLMRVGAGKSPLKGFVYG